MTVIMFCRGWGGKSRGLNKKDAQGLKNHTAIILEDMGFQIAEQVAAAYLAEAGAGLSGKFQSLIFKISQSFYRFCKIMLLSWS